MLPNELGVSFVEQERDETIQKIAGHVNEATGEPHDIVPVFDKHPIPGIGAGAVETEQEVVEPEEKKESFLSGIFAESSSPSKAWLQVEAERLGKMHQGAEIKLR